MVMGLGAVGQSRVEDDGVEVSMWSCTNETNDISSMRSSTFTNVQNKERKK